MATHSRHEPVGFVAKTGNLSYTTLPKEMIKGPSQSQKGLGHQIAPVPVMINNPAIEVRYPSGSIKR